MSFLKPSKGSVLVFSLIVLSIILSAAITVATVSVTNQRSATATGKSVQSFQVADSGIELALQKIYKGTYTSSDSLATAMTGMTCSGTTLTKTGVAGGNVSLTLFDNSNNPINCSDTSWRDKVVKVKSEGSAFGTTRVVETAVAAGGNVQLITGTTPPTSPKYIAMCRDSDDVVLPGIGTVNMSVFGPLPAWWESGQWHSRAIHVLPQWAFYHDCANVYIVY